MTTQARVQGASYHPESFASQFEKMSGLSQWVWWLIILVVISALTLIIYLKFETAIDEGLYVMISGLGIGLIVKGFLDARFIDSETRLASEQVRILEEVDDFETFLRRAPQSMFRAHIANLYTISLSHPDVSQDNLIEIIHARLLARNRVVELFASILITLGLIGTILGLMIMMTQLTNIVGEKGATDDLLVRLVQEGGPLSGLSTAFITTLLGAVIGGVILRVLTNVIDSSVMRYTAHLAELTEVHVLPFLRRTAQQRLSEQRAP
jgi:hypothetical protein